MNIAFPLSGEDFRESHFEREPVLFPGALVSSTNFWSALDEALGNVDPSTDFVKLMHNGRVAQDEFVEEFMDIGVRRRRIKKAPLYDRVRKGATLVLNRMDISSPVVRDICLQVSIFAGAQASANGYASFGSEPATNVHWDTHDVFVVQLSGRKHWRLYEPTYPLPISSQSSTNRKSDLTDSFHSEHIVETGDILYVPRGWWHRVTPIPQEETFHLAVGIHAPLMLDYVIWACANKLPNHLPMRHALFGRTIDTSLVADACDTLETVLADPTVLEEFYVRSRARERVVSEFNFDQIFAGGNTGFEDHDVLQLNTRYPAPVAELVVNGELQHLNEDEMLIIKTIMSRPGDCIGHVIEDWCSVEPSRSRRLVSDLIGRDILSRRHQSTINLRQGSSI